MLNFTSKYVAIQTPGLCTHNSMIMIFSEFLYGTFMLVNTILVIILILRLYILGGTSKVFVCICD